MRRYDNDLIIRAFLTTKTLLASRWLRGDLPSKGKQHV